MADHVAGSGLDTFVDRARANSVVTALSTKSLVPIFHRFFVFPVIASFAAVKFESFNARAAARAAASVKDWVSFFAI